jgi:hypothetical protein
MAANRAMLLYMFCLSYMLTSHTHVRWPCRALRSEEHTSELQSRVWQLW